MATSRVFQQRGAPGSAATYQEGRISLRLKKGGNGARSLTSGTIVLLGAKEIVHFLEPGKDYGEGGKASVASGENRA